MTELQTPMLRIVSTGVSARTPGETIPLTTAAMTIGRASDCAIVLDDHSVSRHHALIEATPAGYRLRDTESANGILVGDRLQLEVQLVDGLQFAIGETVFEFVTTPAAEVSAPQPFILRVVRSNAPGAVGTEFTVSGIVTIGRGPECTIPLNDRSTSHRHAIVQLVDAGFRVTDTDSKNGVWLDDQRISDTVLSAGQVFRIGDTYLACHPQIEDEASGPPQVISEYVALMAKVAARQLAEAGDAVSVSGVHGLLLNDPSCA